ncbi:Phosphoethanolamine N-methyltransferase 3 [Fusarium austroafricanum]|uniref:Phosphoethanolamine N-methyltransferase 3 n=1 Tax=Fusarium austroafricanum TaxID=2364996 RepID=A0A8H4KAU7_9HYPO|nr:Phosphoethanolamine N-methyltransferase 3 [Fusarium austroafricanum]
MSAATSSAPVVSTQQPAEPLSTSADINSTNQSLEPVIPREADDEADADNGSALSSGPESSTASVTSSILEYRKFKGRAYHSACHDSSYPIPTDEQTLENFDIMHHFLTLLTDDKLYLAPVKDDIQKVLDVGTGTGVWAIDYADEHPNTTVTGTDLSAVQPDWVPPNLKFEIDDCTKPWTWDANTFDFVHMRYLFGAIRDWTALFKEAYNAVKPGGWVESCESEPMTHSDDGTVTNDGSTALGGTWDKMFIEGGKATGCSLSVLSEDLQMIAMKEAGFVDIQEVFYKANPKLAEIGQYAKLSLESDLVGYSQMIWHEVLKWPADEYQIFLMQVRKDLRNKKLHPYFKVRFVWGRKPEENEQK